MQTQTELCACWSCGGQCGGTNDPAAGSCGPLEPVDGHPLCEACREEADVFDTERTGAKVTLDQEKVRLSPDVFGTKTYGGSLWLDAASARHLARLLLERAAELEPAPGWDGPRADAIASAEPWHTVSGCPVEFYEDKTSPGAYCVDVCGQRVTSGTRPEQARGIYLFMCELDRATIGAILESLRRAAETTPAPQ